jgi:hypothetical protein
MEMRQPFWRALAPIVATALLATVLTGVVPARAAATLLVPEQYPTITAAISAAVAGDVIDVAPGVYSGGLTVNKSVTIRGRAPDATDPRNNTTILDGGGVTPITVPAGPPHRDRASIGDDRARRDRARRETAAAALGHGSGTPAGRRHRVAHRDVDTSRPRDRPARLAPSGVEAAHRTTPSLDVAS